MKKQNQSEVGGKSPIRNHNAKISQADTGLVIQWRKGTILMSNKVAVIFFLVVIVVLATKGGPELLSKFHELMNK